MQHWKGSVRCYLLLLVEVKSSNGGIRFAVCGDLGQKSCCELKQDESAFVLRCTEIRLVGHLARDEGEGHSSRIDMVSGECGMQLLPGRMVTRAEEQHVLDGVEVEWRRLSAGGIGAGGILHLAQNGVATELGVGAVGPDAGSDSHHRVALYFEVE